jgi:hypothetical protein
LRVAGVGGEALGEEVLRIPILMGAKIGDTAEHGRTGALPVRRKDRFPDCEHADLHPAMRLQDLLDCGRPPQTGGSSGREQDDDARLAGGLVEVGLKLLEIQVRGYRGRTTGKTTREQPSDYLRHHGDHPHQQGTDPEDREPCSSTPLAGAARAIELPQAKKKKGAGDAEQVRPEPIENYAKASRSRRGGDAERETAGQTGESTYQRRDRRELFTVLHATG